MSRREVLCIGARADGGPLVTTLEGAGWKTHFVSSASSARRVLGDHVIRVGLLWAPDIDEATCAELDALMGAHQQLEWIGCFGLDALQRQCVRQLIVDHLFDHHTLPYDAGHLLHCLGHAYGHAEMRATAEQDHAQQVTHEVVGSSAAISKLLVDARRAAATSAPVLIVGESGTGKELIARAIHRQSSRAQAAFVAVNCGALPPALIQSELFGHERGAFTGAHVEKRGVFEAANGGTVFLDEIGDFPLDLQSNLLRFLEEGTIHRVGSTRPIQLRVRVVAATNLDLDRAVAEKRFRLDLFYRLSVLPLHVPPLR